MSNQQLYKTFSTEKHDQLKENMFFGKNVNVSRFDQQRHPIFESLIEKQLSFFWRPEEIDLSTDRNQFRSMNKAEKHIFISNIKYQSLLDAVQGRSPNVALLPITSLPELETWIETWAFSETIHSRSYTHIMRNCTDDPGAIFDEILDSPEINERAKEVTKYYDDLIEHIAVYQIAGLGEVNIKGKFYNITESLLKEKAYLTMASVNILEGVRFYVSFACAFAFNERELMEGNSKIVKFIARDENLHMQGTQYILNTWANGLDDPAMVPIAERCKDKVLKMFDDAVLQEKEWARYLFKFGSMIGLNENVLCQYVEYIANVRLMAIGYEARYPTKTNPLPWIKNYLNSDNVQVAPQEAEISSYLVGQVDSNVDMEEMENMDVWDDF